MIRRWTIVNVALGAIVALLLFEVYQTWARAVPIISYEPESAPRSAPAGARGRAKRGADAAQHEPTMLVAAIAEKDLFDPSRRPLPVEVAPVIEPARVVEPPPGCTIVGVKILGRDREVFMSCVSEGSGQKRLRPGDQVSGYTVKEIEPAQVRFVSPSGDPVVMPLAVERAKGGGPMPPPRPVRATPRPPQAPGAGSSAAGSPAAGVQTTSPAAGIQPPPALGATAPPAVPNPANPQAQLPPEVRQKLEQLQHRERRGQKR